MKKIYATLLVGSSIAMSGTFMDAAWAQAMCRAWNNNATLSGKLGKWAKNNGGKGYKIIRMYRDGCGKASAIELQIAPKGDKAVCIKAGKASAQKANYDVDYMMHAKDKDWTCMGKGSFGCGAMGAMMSGKLKFKGPKLEAMGVMSPFGAFLKLTGSVPGDKKSCPK